MDMGPFGITVNITTGPMYISSMNSGEPISLMLDDRGSE